MDLSSVSSQPLGVATSPRCGSISAFNARRDLYSGILTNTGEGDFSMQICVLSLRRSMRDKRLLRRRVCIDLA